MPLLEVKNLSIKFGGLKAVQNVSFNVERGQIVSIIGPNGAGKTTIFNMLTGFYVPDEGEMFIGGNSLLGKSAHDFVQFGIARTFQNIRLYHQLSVIENVLIGYQSKLKQSIWDGLTNNHTKRKGECEANKKAEQMLNDVNMLSLRNELCTNLPYGKQKTLEIARALMSEPELLFLDEPAAGLNPSETKELSLFIRNLANTGITVVLIEHDLRLVMGISDYIYVIDHGLKIAEGIPSEVQKNDSVIAAYIGRKGVAQSAAFSKEP